MPYNVTQQHLIVILYCIPLHPNSSHPITSYHILSYRISYYHIKSHPIPLYPLRSYLTLSYLILLNPISPYPTTSQLPAPSCLKMDWSSISQAVHSDIARNLQLTGTYTRAHVQKCSYI